MDVFVSLASMPFVDVEAKQWLGKPARNQATTVGKKAAIDAAATAAVGEDDHPVVPRALNTERYHQIRFRQLYRAMPFILTFFRDPLFVERARRACDDILPRRAVEGIRYGAITSKRTDRRKKPAYCLTYRCSRARSVASFILLLA
ncbi:hypothetical protein AB7M17_007877 [Bradyrhizobium sp. USDA 377]